MAETAPDTWTDYIFCVHGCVLTSAGRPAVLAEWVGLPQRPRHSPASHKASAETFNVSENQQTKSGESAHRRARWGSAATVARESDLLSLDNDSGALLEESVLQRQDRPAGDLVELKYPPYPGGILL